MTIPSFPTAEQLLFVLARSVEYLDSKLDPDQIVRMASAFETIRWNFTDVGLTMYIVFEKSTQRIVYASSVDGEVSMVVDIDSRTLHETAWGVTSFGAAFIAGKLKVKGVQPLKLTKFIPLLEPFLASYREAMEELYDQS